MEGFMLKVFVCLIILIAYPAILYCGYMVVDVFIHSTNTIGVTEILMFISMFVIIFISCPLMFYVVWDLIKEL